MTIKRRALRDWHRLFGLLMIDLFSGSPFTVEVETDLSVQQQLLDVVIVRRGRGRFSGRLPDGLDGLREHNLVTFKSHHEALDAWAMNELIGHWVAYRKLVSRSPSALLPENQFGLYGVCARFPQQLSGRVPWQAVKPGVYDCLWGTNTIRVLVAGELPREPQNAPLHLFSASPVLIGEHEWPAGPTLQRASGGGVSHAVHDGGFPARVFQGALFGAHTGGPGGCDQVAAPGGASGRPVRRADPAISGSVVRRTSPSAA